MKLQTCNWCFRGDKQYGADGNQMIFAVPAKQFCSHTTMFVG